MYGYEGGRVLAGAAIVSEKESKQVLGLNSSFLQICWGQSFYIKILSNPQLLEVSQIIKIIKRKMKWEESFNG